MSDSKRAPMPSEDRPSDQWLTVPNGLCVLRFLGSFGLVPLAVYEHPVPFLLAFMALSSTDWIDGKLARYLDQESRIGPTLDSVADVTMYGSLLFGAVWLFSDVLFAERLLIGVAVASYAASCFASLWKFRRLPSYHTRAAKVSWGATVLAAMALFADWSLWPLRIAALFVSLTNVEALLITVVLDERQDNLPTVLHAVRQRLQG